MDVAPHTDDLDIASVDTRDEFSALLRTVHRRADRPSLRTLEARSRHGAVPLSKTVVSEMLKGTRFPRKTVVLAFLQACGIEGERAEPWLRAWERIAERPAGPHEAGGAPAAAGPQAGISGVAVDGHARPRAAPGPSAAGAAGGRPPDRGLQPVADAAETRVLRERVSQLTADNERLRAHVAASRGAVAPAAGRPGGEDGGRVAHSPPASRWELGVLLRALRVEKGMPIDQAAERLLCSTGKIRRMESGFRSGTLRDVRDLCDLYGVTDGAQRDHLLQLARDSKPQGRQQSYAPHHLARYIGLESDAPSIKSYEPMLIPGLLQTAGYARAVFQKAAYNLSAEEIERRVETRLARQYALTRPGPPIFSVIIDEAVLRRLMGGPTVMRMQIGHMIDVSAMPSVSIQVMPFSAGENGVAEGNFTILEFADPIPGLVFADGATGVLCFEGHADVEYYRRVFNIMSAAALSREKSVELAKQIVRALEDQE